MKINLDMGRVKFPLGVSGGEIRKGQQVSLENSNAPIIYVSSTGVARLYNGQQCFNRCSGV